MRVERRASSRRPKEPAREAPLFSTHPPVCKRGARRADTVTNQRLRPARRLAPRAGILTKTFKNSSKRERARWESVAVELRDFIFRKIHKHHQCQPTPRVWLVAGVVPRHGISIAEGPFFQSGAVERQALARRDAIHHATFYKASQSGGPCGNRTYNLVIKSHLLCQLS